MEGKAVEISESELHSMLIDVGVKLLAPPSSVAELLAILDKAEVLLGFLGQDPSPAVQNALLPAMKGLVSDMLFRHPGMDVKVNVLSCIHKLVRITAPKGPYEHDTMKEIFQRTLIVFGKLSLLSGRCYTKALNILETIAKVRSCLILLDIGCDVLIIQTFQILLDTIGPDHPDAIFTKMEEIMTLLIEESDEISLDLLKPLITSVKKENQNISPLSWRLGVKVLQNCSAKVKPYLVQTVEKMRLDIQDYTDTIVSVWPDVSSEENTPVIFFSAKVIKKAATNASDLVRTQGAGTQHYKGSLVDENSSNKLVSHEQIQQLQLNAKESVQVQPEGSKSGEGLQKKESVEVFPRRKGSKPEERCEYSGASGGAASSEVFRKRKNYGEVGSLPENISGEESPLVSKPVSLEMSPIRDQTKKKKTIKNALGKKENFPNDSAMKNKRTTLECLDRDSFLKRDRKPRGVNEYREELIGSRVKIWWPADHEFYEGVVESYDPFKKQHKIVYVDGDVETLRLKKERWILLDDISNRRGQEADRLSSSVAPEKSEKERAAGLGSKKKNNASSSKRSRSQTEPNNNLERSVASYNEGILAIRTERDATKENKDERPPMRYARRHSL